MSTTQSESSITLTEAAAEKIAELIQEEGGTDLALRVAVKPGGCSGYSYDMFFDNEIADDDVVSQYGDVRVAVDPGSAALLAGATLDFKNGLQDAGFTIDNPSASRTCGCGNSFS